MAIIISDASVMWHICAPRSLPASVLTKTEWGERLRWRLDENRWRYNNQPLSRRHQLQGVWQTWVPEKKKKKPTWITALAKWNINIKSSVDPGAAEEKWLPVGNIKAEWDNQRDVLPSLLYLSLLSCFVFFSLAPSASSSSECHVSQSAKSLSLLSDVLLMRCSNAALFPPPHFFFHCITPSLCKKRVGVRTSLLDECAVFGDEVAERRGRGWKGEKK